MNKLKLAAAVGALMLGAVSAQNANAGVVFSDNFDTQNGGVGTLNYTGFPDFTISNAAAGGAVDLIGNGFFDFYPGNGLYVDICGSASVCGDLTTNTSFAPGAYNVTVSLGGNGRIGGSDTSTVSIGGVSKTFTLSEFQQAVETFHVVLTSASPLTVSDGGVFGADVGNVLFSVNVSSAVPEPATWAVMVLGFGGMGAAMRNKRRKLAASAA